MWPCVSRAAKAARRHFSTVLPLREASNSLKVFQEGDVALLRRSSNNQPQLILTKPLKPKEKVHTHHGYLSHDDIIGKSAGTWITTNTDQPFRVQEPTLAEYTTLTYREVTPIYPGEASNIVHHLDIHPPTSKQDPQLNILEAGTGHGALTLFLARAIYGSSPDKAVIHSVERSQSLSNLARKNLRQFRNGKYERNVKFHTGDVTEFLRSECNRLEVHGHATHFLSHAVLDLPHAHTHLSAVADAMRTDGTLAVFAPHITQIVDCIRTIKERSVGGKQIPFATSEVVELGANHSTGRQWEVAVNKPKKSRNTSEVSSENKINHRSTGKSRGDEDFSWLDISHLEGVESGSDPELSTLTAPRIEKKSWDIICRPKYGYTVTGGGFLGLFRRLRDPIAKSTSAEAVPEESSSTVPSSRERNNTDETDQDTKSGNNQDASADSAKYHNSVYDDVSEYWRKWMDRSNSK